MKRHRILTAILLVATATSCRTEYDNRSFNRPGRPTVYSAPDTPGEVTGIGIESQDVLRITDSIVRDMLRFPRLATAATPPRIVIDNRYLRNESASVINTSMITDALRVGLSRAAGSRIVFLGREYVEMVESERGAEQRGDVSAGTVPASRKLLGWDFRLGGRITSVDGSRLSDGMAVRFHQIVLELVERGSGVIVWSGTYRFRKTARDDIIYR